MKSESSEEPVWPNEKRPVFDVAVGGRIPPIQVATSWILAPARNTDDEIEGRRKLGFRPYRCQRRPMIFLGAACKCPAKPPSAEGRRAVSREVGVSLFATKRFICHTLVPVMDLPIAGVFRGLVSCQMLMPSLSLMWR